MANRDERDQEETEEEQEDEGSSGSGSEEQEDEGSSGSEEDGEPSDASSDDEGQGSIEEHLIMQLRDAHSLEHQALRKFERAIHLTKDTDANDGYRDHYEKTQEHERIIRERIEAHEVEPSGVQDLTMRAGAIGLRQLSDVPPENPVKLAMHFYAFAQLQVVTYELLIRIAKEAGDEDTAECAEKILEEEKETVEQIAGTFDDAASRFVEQPDRKA